MRAEKEDRKEGKMVERDELKAAQTGGIAGPSLDAEAVGKSPLS